MAEVASQFPAASEETLDGWGMAHRASSRVYRPTSAAGAAEALADALARGLSIGHRGAGQSYGDAALNGGGAVLDLSGMNRILDFDAATGVVRAEAGVTVAQLWRHVIGDGWWPPVVPGTAAPTLGGCVAMNVHGKNQYQVGSVGEHVLSATVLRSSGAVDVLRREAEGGSPEPPPLSPLDRVIGAQGLTGTILSVTLQLKRVHSGFLDVAQRVGRGLDETLDHMEALSEEEDYAVGWLDAFAAGARRGRGILHGARHLPPGHPAAGTGLDVPTQTLPPRAFGVFPRSQAWRLLSPWVHDPGMRLMNLVKYTGGAASGHRRYLQSHGHFHFLLDAFPGWSRIYRPHGFLQYQLFIPAASARDVLREALALQQRIGEVSYLAVLKRHRSDRFPASYSLDGFSLALDFPLRPRRRERLLDLCRELDVLRESSGGRIYAAKDGVSRGDLPNGRDPAYGSDLVRRWSGDA